MIAKSYGDELIVGVASNQVIFEDKGASPVINLAQRTLIVQNIKCVDEACPYYAFEFLTHLKKFKPDVVCWGSFDPSAKRYIEANEYIEENGISCFLLPRSNYNSTTEIKSWVKKFT